MNVDFAVTCIVRAVKTGVTPKEACDDLLKNGFTRSVVDEALSQYQQRVAQVRIMGEPASMYTRDREDWYPGPSDNDPCWPLLKRYLRDVKKWPASVIQSVDDASTKIVSLLAAPGKKEFCTRGLVLGYVQSGKTANFTAVISKAADAGYKLFIVLSGLHNGLRKQTQERLDAELVNLRPGHWHSLTSLAEDFKQQGNTTAYLVDHSAQRVLCVMKKNSARLRALLRWLRRTDPATLKECPMLMIDDEADQASVDTKGTEDPSIINKLILDILKLFPRGGYVAYTATPFANILSDPSTASLLYPKDFIVDLPRPEEYFGTERIFGSEPMVHEGDEHADGPAMIRLVSDDDVKLVQPPGRDGRDAFDPQLPVKLREALRWFWLACAIRRARGQESQHMSMLVHTTLYTDVQKKFENLFLGEVRAAHISWEANDAGFRTSMQTLWDLETAKVSAASTGEVPIDFETAWSRLGQVLDSLRVIIDNARSESRLFYPPGGSTTIVVGGNTLSRGLTIEGLMVSYFVRTSTMYDTLLQMGRWFGYRQGYSDLPRIWMTGELVDYFQHLAHVELELREDIARYEKEGLTPRDFAPRIQTHSTLAVTSPLKMRYAVECDISYAEAVKQTTYFPHRDQAWLHQNIEAAQELLLAADRLRKPEHVWDQHWLWRDIPFEEVLSFLENYQIHERHGDMRPEVLRRYIQAQNGERQLIRWNIGVVSLKDDRAITWDGLLPGGQPVRLMNRARFMHTEPANLKAIMSKTDRAIDFDLPAAPRQGRDGKGLIQWMDEQRSVPEASVDPGRGVNTPLLLLYPVFKDSQPLNPGEIRLPLNAAEHIVGLALVFPRAARFTPQSYVTADLSRIDEKREELEYTPEAEL